MNSYASSNKGCLFLKSGEDPFLCWRDNFSSLSVSHRSETVKEDPRMTLPIILLIAGLALLVFAADWLVQGSAKIAAAVGISPLIVGLTVVAFGTSAPELAVSVMSAFKGETEIAVGNVVGSNVFNVLVVLGLSAVIIPLVVNQQLIRFDVPVMIILSFGLYGLSMDGMLNRVDGMILVAALLGYVLFLLRQSKRERNAAVLNEYEEEFGDAGKDPQWLKNICLIVVGISGLVLGSKWLVDGAVDIAKHFGVSELMIGLTIVSIGTSLPEVATSVMAALKGERDIAVGNVVGSNIFIIVSVLGLSSVVAPGGILVPQAALDFDLWVMIAVAVATLLANSVISTTIATNGTTM
jgi:cation:H+ antiporter